MKVLVTGCAGFIGSHLAERLLKDGEEVIGVDALTPYYPVPAKELNLQVLKAYPAFKYVQKDLSEEVPPGLLDDAEVIYHLAGQPGVRASWGADFGLYVRHNIIATQLLLERMKGRPVKRLVYASSSSVYGNLNKEFFSESDLPRPYSPYGVTKLAAEHLVNSYVQNFSLSAVSLRFFTVFGPRQRPDMAFHRLIDAALHGKEFSVFGDGSQMRDFTYVSDIVEGCLAASTAGTSGEIYNLGGSNLAALSEVIDSVQSIVGKKLHISYLPPQKGDVRKTSAEISKAAQALKYSPRISLQSGLARQIDYQKSL